MDSKLLNARIPCIMTTHMEKYCITGINFLLNMLYSFHFNFYKPIQVNSDSKEVSRHLNMG